MNMQAIKVCSKLNTFHFRNPARMRELYDPTNRDEMTMWGCIIVDFEYTAEFIERTRSTSWELTNKFSKIYFDDGMVIDGRYNKDPVKTAKVYDILHYALLHNKWPADAYEMFNEQDDCFEQIVCEGMDIIF